MICLSDFDYDFSNNLRLSHNYALNHYVVVDDGFDFDFGCDALPLS